jgi:lipoprotein-anchoring transpeptidase ErfK/SrfK
MHTPRVGSLRPGAQVILTALFLSTLLFTSACGANPQIQQQASQNQTQLNSLLQRAQSIGVPQSLLQPIIKQKQQLVSTQAPFNIFDSTPATNYYRNIGTRYGQLMTQTQGIIDSTTSQDQTQAQFDVHSYTEAVSEANTQKLPVQYFQQQLSSMQADLSTAKYPKDYTAVSTQIQALDQSLTLLKTTSSQLTTFKNTINQMQLAHLDITAMQMQYQSDQQQLAVAQVVPTFQKLSAVISAQYLQAVVSTNLALPYVVSAKLSDISSKVQFLKTYGIDTTLYQQSLDADKVMARKVTNVQQYIQFSKQVDTDITSMQADLVTGQANALLQQFHKEADAWSKLHMYHDKFDGNNYSMDAAYQDVGMGSMLDEEMTWNYSVSDYQGMIQTIQDELFNLHMFEADYQDKTPFNKVHATDIQLLDHYKLQKGQVIIVSTAEQALRLYQDGKLVTSFLVTTGRAELPALAGEWTVQNRQSPTEFTSPDPVGSPYYYPPTHINYAILYHHGGYFLHDSWWRLTYGPGTQFPHVDASGDTVFSNNGSHGCVNLPEAKAAWLYANTDFSTTIIIY